jgi:hypothetical protein
MPHKHNWIEIERTGNVVLYRCSICGKRKLRVE